MTKTILIYPPFCSPASPPYSITGIYSFIKKNLSKQNDIQILDLNIEFHLRKYPEYLKYYKSFLNNYNLKEYDEITTKYRSDTQKDYSENHKKIRNGEKPEFFHELLNLILNEKPDIVAFSIVFSSQAFYTSALIEELKKHNIKTVIGGPAVNDKLTSIVDASLNNELEMLEYIENKKINHEKLDFSYFPDFSHYDIKKYFISEFVYPIRTTNTCYYKQCAFCTHYNNNNIKDQTRYYEFPLDKIENSIKISKAKYMFIVDDMVHKKRLLELATIFKKYNVKWLCQLKPTKDLDYETLKTLYDSGLRMIMWGVESANNRVLNKICKATNKIDIQNVLSASHKAGIKNITYIMFGFPTETSKELYETIEFLETNKEFIDLISVAIFGLQEGSKVYAHPKDFGIDKITTEERTILGPIIKYTVKEGLNSDEAEAIRKKNSKRIEQINKFPKNMNFFKEHMLILISELESKVKFHKRSAVIISNGNKILLLQRIKKERKYYVIPGGTVEENESFEETAIREIKEETGLDIELGKKFLELHDEKHFGKYYLSRKILNPELISKIKFLGTTELEKMSKDNKYKLEWIELKDISNLKLYPEEVKDKIVKYFSKVRF